MKSILSAILATSLFAISSAQADPGDIEIGVDAATDGLSTPSQNLLQGGIIEIGWLNPGTTRAQIQGLFASGDLAGIDSLFNQVVVVPFPGSSLDFNSNGGQYFDNVILVPNGDVTGLAAYKNPTTGAAGKDWFSWVRNSASLDATTLMAFIDGVGAFPTANDTLGFTDFAGTFAHSVPPAGTEAWVGTFAPILTNSQIDNFGDGNIAGDGLGATGSANVLQLATVIPEPGSAALVCLGMAGLAGLRRRRA